MTMIPSASPRKKAGVRSSMGAILCRADVRVVQTLDVPLMLRLAPLLHMTEPSSPNRSRQPRL